MKLKSTLFLFGGSFETSKSGFHLKLHTLYIWVIFDQIEYILSWRLKNWTLLNKFFSTSKFISSTLHRKNKYVRSYFYYMTVWFDWTRIPEISPLLISFFYIKLLIWIKESIRISLFLMSNWIEFLLLLMRYSLCLI